MTRKELIMTALDKTLYTARTHVTGGREGAARSSDARLDVKLSLPGGPGNGTNPEQLFAAGWSACFIGAMAQVATARKIVLPRDVSVDAEVDLGTASGGFLLRARLIVSLPGIEPEIAREIVEGARQTCPYSKAIRGNIDATVDLA